MFITVEGIDGCGKTTVSRALWKELNKIGYKVAYTYEPTNSSIGNLIKKCFASPFTEAFLFMADRAEHQKWIRKKLEKSFVICDRYMDSTTAYQGEKLKKFLKEPISFLSNIQKSFVIIPNITFLILVPVELCLKRIEKRKKTRFEKEKYLRGVEKNYLEIAKNEKRIVKVDGTNPIEDVVRFLVEYIKDRALKV